MKLNRILLIDDDSITNFLHQSLLETAEIADDILIAETVPEAVKALTEIKSDTAFPQLIFVDLNMPGLSGWDFIKEYSQLKIDRNLKSVVVVLTTSLNPDDKKRAENLSAVTEFRRKPLTLGMVDEITNQYFGE
jgi:CheY-like chemotaxis protein